MKMPPWSYSSLTAYETCPRQYYHVKVAKDFVSGDTEATLWGKRVHKDLEDFVGEGTPLPEYAVKWAPLMKAITKRRDAGAEVFTEQELAVTVDFHPTDFRSTDAWARGIADLVVVEGEVATSIDYKTGKRKPGSKQLEMSAAMLFAKMPEVQIVKTGFMWLKDNRMDKDAIHRKEIPVIWNGFIERTSRMEKSYENDSWPVKTSGLCAGWCPVKTCKFWKEKRK